MRFNPNGKKLLYTPSLPTRHRVYSTEAVRLTGRLARELQAVLYQLQRTGIIGSDERMQVMKEILKVSEKMTDLNKRERIAIAARLQEDFGHVIPTKMLTELMENPDRLHVIANSELRKRLRSCEMYLIDNVAVMVEALKRLRYTNWIEEKDYVRWSRVLQSLPKLRMEMLDIFDKYGDG